MLDYFIKSTLILGILFIFYKIILENEKMHVFKRGYLLLSLIAACTIPIIIFTEVIYIAPTLDYFSYSPEYPHAVSEIINPEPLPTYNVLFIIYCTGVFILSVRFILNLWNLKNKIISNKIIKEAGHVRIFIPEKISPFSFFHYIFLPENDALFAEIPNEVILHEVAHIQQKHSIDVIFVELLHIFFWINPFIFMFKKMIKLNHEFLADESVLNSGIHKGKYQSTILDYAQSTNSPILSNPLYIKPIKTRFMQMNHFTSKKSAYIRSILVLPLLILLVYGFSQKSTITLEKTTAETINIEILNTNYFLIEGKYIAKMTSLVSVIEKIIAGKSAIERKEISLVVETLEEINPEYVDLIIVELQKLNLIIKEIKLAGAIKEEQLQYRVVHFMYEDGDMLSFGRRINLDDLKSTIEGLNKLEDPMTGDNTAIELLTSLNTDKNLVLQAENILKQYGKVKIKFTTQTEPGWRPGPQEKATKNQLAEYEVIAKKYKHISKMAKDEIQDAEIDKLIFIYNSMSIEQKNNSVEMPDVSSYKKQK